MPSPRKRKQHKWTAAERTVAFRAFINTDSLSETSRQTGVPIGTLAGWLDDPAHAGELARIRKIHARAVNADDSRLARAATAVVGKAIGRIASEIDSAQGKDLAALTRAALAIRVELHRIGRLDGGKSTENLALLPARAEALDAELDQKLSDPRVAARVEAALRKRRRA